MLQLSQFPARAGKHPWDAVCSGLTDDADFTAGHGITLCLPLTWLPQTGNQKVIYWIHPCNYFEAQMFSVSLTIL